MDYGNEGCLDASRSWILHKQKCTLDTLNSFIGEDIMWWCPEESGSFKPQVTIFAGDFPHFVPPTAASMPETPETPEEQPSADVADMEPSAPPLLEWTMISTPPAETTTLCNVAGFGASKAV
jgi:hypothetical protein